MPDLAALTDLERQVVWASIRPLARMLPTLAERDVKMRILPIDVRATDVDLFKDAAGVIGECIAASSIEERTDQGLMTEKLRVELRRFFKKRTGRRPLVLPVLMEI